MLLQTVTSVWDRLPQVAMPEILNFEKYECEVTFHLIHTARVTRCLSEGVKDTDIGVMSKSPNQNYYQCVVL